MNVMAPALPDFGIHPHGYRAPAQARVGRVRLAVSNLDRSVAFYTRVIGLRILASDGTSAHLAPHGSSQVLLELEELPGVRPIAPASRLGLYHTAFLLPTRNDLGRFVQHLNQRQVPFGAGDHLYSEALYLTDPDGLTVEVYADRNRATWQVDGRELLSATSPVRLAELAALSQTEAPWLGMPAKTTVGHIHLYVGQLSQAQAFYHQGLGLDITTWRFPGALFLSAGGYHHHVAVNTWAAGSPIASEADARLLQWELVLPTENEIARAAASLSHAGFRQQTTASTTPEFADPWNIRVALIPESSSTPAII